MAKTPSDIKSLARVHTKTALNTLAGIMRQPDAPAAARVMASKELLDRGFGRPAQSLAIGQDESLGPIKISWADK